MNATTTVSSAPALRHSRAALFAAVTGFFVITLDAVVVNVALRQISLDLGATITGLQWIVDGYTLLFASCLLSAGAFSDRIGARRAYGIGMAAFVITSLGCGLAPTVGVLILARILQGTAAAVMLPASMALIGEAFPDPAKRARAVGMWAMGGALASISGPVLGGLLSLVDWRLIFLINLPVGAAALILLGRVPRSAHRTVPVDWAGQLTAFAAMGALTYGAIEAGAAGITAPLTLIAFAAAGVAGAGFVIAERRGPHPMVPLPLLRDRTMAVSIGIGFSYMVGYFGLPFVMSLYAQQERGLSPVETGALFVPMMLGGAILTPFIARLSERLGARTLIIGGLTLMAAGLTVIALLPGGTPIWVLAAVMILVGLAGPLVIPTITAVLLNSFDRQRAGTVSGIFNTSRQIGGALAVAVFGSLLARSTTFLQGFSTSLLIAAGLALAMSVLATRLPRR
ncbi:MFS transporter [Arthrobacter oryzae]|uniref:EmrB/QacA subfamily drug resistance transporter n=1 Tax=Arthrobacter oryzae TaxID=409290 RepID=A0A495FMV6_9MICC|nr:MFS transporter [Arthrobacter oryzae]RKR30550.1 EmrB/QacA subfamily drug resistance transporter [Arthrobacter oryzae]